MLYDKEDVLLNNPGFVEEFRELLKDPEGRYYYHMTGNGGEIITSGLYMAVPKVVSTMIPINEDMINDPIEFLLSERTNGLRATNNMILLDLPDEGFIHRDDFSTLYNDQGQLLKYKIPSQYIIGYIDLDDFEIIYNENYTFDDSYSF